jgi:hypothetical protein
MKIRIYLEDDNGEIFWEEDREAEFPFDFRLPPDRPEIGKKYRYYGFVYQPLVKPILQEN